MMQSHQAVALRKESVDRNAGGLIPSARGETSLSARRAWIEMSGDAARLARLTTSLSARRAWIEINCNGRRYDS